MAAIQEAAIRLGTIAVEEYAVPAAKKLWREKLSPAARKSKRKAPAPSGDEPKVSSTETPPSEVAVSLEVTGHEDSGSGTGIDPSMVVNMTRDEAQWHADAARAAFEEFLRHAGALRNARVVDDEGIAELTAGRHALESSGTRSLDVGKPEAKDTNEGPASDPIPFPIRDRSDEQS